MSKCDERFARQYRYEPPPGFPLASPYSDIVHHLSGPNRNAHTQTFLSERDWPGVQQSHRLLSLCTHMLSCLYSRMCVDSLIRVSRRVVSCLFHNTVRTSYALESKALGLGTCAATPCSPLPARGNSLNPYLSNRLRFPNHS